MTFTVIESGSGSERVVGTIWANAEAEAQSIASDLLQVREGDKVVLRRAAEREIPMKLFN